jgi:hypothetical protein
MSMRILVGALLGAAFTLAGCGGFDCSKAGKCPSDIAPDQTEVAACDARVADSACGDKYKDYASCYLDNEQCTPAGDSDVNATNADCASSFATLQACCAAAPGSFACSP